MAEEKKTVNEKPALTKRQQKNRRNMITACVSLAVVLVLAVAVRLTIGAIVEEEEEETATYGVMRMDADDVTRVEIHNSYGDMNFYYNEEDETWYYEDDADFPVDQSIFSQVGAQIDLLYSEVEIDSTSERLEEYGLTDSNVIVCLFDEDGTEESFYLGSYNSTMNGYYLYNSRRDLIYIVDSTFGTLFSTDLYSYAEVDDFPTLDSTTFVSIEKTTGENAYILDYIEEGISSNMYSTMSWYFSKPFGEMRAVAEDKATDLMSEIADISFQKLVNYYCTGDDLAQYGLDDPEVFYIYYWDASGTDDDGNTTYNSNLMQLSIGDLDEDGTYYYASYKIYVNGLISVDNKKVSLISRSDVDWLINLDPFDYMYSNIFYALLSEMDSFELTYNGETYVFDIEVDEEGETVLGSNSEYTYANSAYTYYANGAEVTDGDVFREGYQALVSIKAIEIMKDEYKIDVDPVITISLSMPDNELDSIVVEFTPYDASSYQVTVNGVTDFKCSKQETLDAVDAMLAVFDVTK